MDLIHSKGMNVGKKWTDQKYVEIKPTFKNFTYNLYLCGNTRNVHVGDILVR